MVKPIAITIAIMSVMPSLAVADACRSGFIYCGYNLLYTGRYRGEILDELERVGLSNINEHVHESTFYCGIGGEGWITFKEFCPNGCHDGGEGRNDQCS